MIIAVREKTGKRFRIVVPTGIVLNRLTACFIPAAMERRGIALTREQLVKIIQALRDCRRRNRGWKLLEAERADGSFVEITL